MKILFFAVFLVEVCLSHARGDVSGKQSMIITPREPHVHALSAIMKRVL